MHDNNNLVYDDSKASMEYSNDSKADLISLPPDYAKLPHISQPLCLFPQYFAKDGIEITMQKKASVTAADFEIKCGNDILLYVDTKFFKLNYEKEIRTSAGELLLTLKTSIMSWSRKTIGVLPDGSEVLTVARTNTNILKLYSSPQLEAKFTDQQDLPATIHVDAQVWKNHATMMSNGEKVAKVRTLRALFGERLVTIAPNVDWLLIVAICICFDMHVMELTGTHGGFKSDKRDDKE